MEKTLINLFAYCHSFLSSKSWARKFKLGRRGQKTRQMKSINFTQSFCVYLKFLLLKGKFFNFDGKLFKKKNLEIDLVI